MSGGVIRLGAVGAACLAVLVGAAGCGSGGDDNGAAVQQRLQNAREQAANQQKLKDKLKSLQNQVQHQAQSGGATTTTTTGSTTSAASPPSGSSSCGGDLSVGPNTSCSFAVNVRDAYEKSGGGNVIVKAFSPATNVTYEMACGSTGNQVVCTGGNNASVFFP
ncbi:MAG TPA: hypothetical protein VH391_11585 [Solirubrobacterales bacterium]|jgi:type II secretory pathway pseudopilin PulG